MDTQEIIEHLEHQKQCIENAIAALNGTRPQMRRRKGRKPLSAVARKRISQAQRKRWRELKAKEKKA